MNAVKPQEDSMVRAVFQDTVVRIELGLVAIGLIALTFFSSSSPALQDGKSVKDNSALRDRVRLVSER